MRREVGRTICFEIRGLGGPKAQTDDGRGKRKQILARAAAPARRRTLLRRCSLRQAPSALGEGHRRRRALVLEGVPGEELTVGVRMEEAECEPAIARDKLLIS
uniref:Uncharacterized protein n=1 Tax=Oryza punctata TaxID=4537 RepID=A0A0E0KYW4_ORYPU